MVSAHKEYLYQDEFDAVLDITESDFLEYGNEFQREFGFAFNKNMNLVVEKNTCTRVNHCPIHVLLALKFAFQKKTPRGVPRKRCSENNRCSPVNLLHIFITTFPRNTSGWLAASDLSKVGLTRHINTKHYLETAEPNTKVSKMLRPDVFYEILQKSLKKLTQDECYPEEICSQFTTLE